MNLYSIKDWDEIYETAETRKLETLRWVPVPNKHDGLGYRTIVAERDRSDLFSAWVLILQVASKGRRGERGKLARNGKPLTARDLSLMTGFPEPAFSRALKFFHTEIHWLDSQDFRDISAIPAGPESNPGDSPGCPADSPELAGTSPEQTGLSPDEWKGKKEGNRRGGKDPAHPRENNQNPDPPTKGIPPFTDPDLEEAFQRFRSYRKTEKGRLMGIQEEEQQRLFLSRQEKPIEVIDHTIRCGYINLIPWADIQAKSPKPKNDEKLTRFERSVQRMASTGPV